MKFHLTLFVSFFSFSGLTAHEFQSARPDSHAPIGVMGDHIHAKGDFMASYRYMFMDMDGMRHNTEGVSQAEVFAANYTVSPTEMTMDMHMLGIMYAPTDSITLMGMTSYHEKEMSHTIFPMAAPLIALNGGQSTFTTQSRGLGDMKLAALFGVQKGESNRGHITLGISLPTGSINERDPIPGPGGRIDRQLPAPMQPGSGTTDLLAAYTYSHQRDTWSYGFQGNSVIRMESNSHNYRPANQYEALGWFGWLVHPSASLSISAYAKYEGNLRGNQKNVGLNPPFAPTRRTVTTAWGENYGGDQAGLRWGVNFLGAAAGFKGHRLALEVDIPIYRDLNGYQLETDRITTLGWQKAW